MNFDDTPEEAAFRAEARNWIEANRPATELAAIAPDDTGNGPAQWPPS